MEEVAVATQSCRSALRSGQPCEYALAFCVFLHYTRRNIAPDCVMLTDPCWTTSRLWAPRFLH
jgi:hypothetical protein